MFGPNISGLLGFKAAVAGVEAEYLCRWQVQTNTVQ